MKVYTKALVGFKQKFSRNYFQRTTLFFCAIVMAITITQPAEVAALGFWDKEKGTDFADALTVASETDEAKQQKVLIDDETPLAKEQKPADRTIVNEDTSKRSAFSSVYRNKDGTRTMKFSTTQKNFKQNGKWEKIDNTLTPEATETPERTWWEILTFQEGEAAPAETFNGEAGSIDATMQSFSEGTELEFENKKLVVKPTSANDVKPEKKDDRTVVYRDAWNNVDAEYQLRGETVKEVLVVKNKNSPTTFNFDIEGGTLKEHPTREGELAIEGVDPNKYSFSSLTLDVNGRGVIGEKRVSQKPTSSGLQVTLDDAWVKSLPDDSFPLRIDPSFYRFNTDGGSIFRSDGFSCNPANCYYNTGTLNDNGWKHWRSYFNFDYNQLSGGKKVLEARLRMPMERGINGDESSRQIKMSWANCISFNCVGQGAVASANAGLTADLNFTSILQDRLNVNDYGGWFGIWGEEGPYKSYKPFYEMHIDVLYDTPTPAAQATFPSDKQVITDTQPTLRVNPVSDADGEAVNYRYRVSTSANGSGVAINSDWTSQTQWTIPEGILQDGTTYYWRVDSKGTSSTGTATLGTAMRQFKVDLRKGKDSTQSFDSVGPIGVDLATGNGTTTESTHNMSALGGDIGLTLNYDTTAESLKGLLGKYWSVPTNYSGDVPTSSPAIQRNDKEVNFDWGTASPGGGVTPDWFYAQWTGYFIPPTTGSYQFGTRNDDGASIRINDQIVHSTGLCNTSTCFATGIPLTAGKPVKIDMRMREYGGPSMMRAYIKGAVPEQIIPRDWLRTPVMPSKAAYGLKGYYYNYDSSQTFPVNSNDPNRLMMARNDTKLSFNWGSDGPAPGLQKDKFLVRWAGYITVPSSGSYTLGIDADDGARIKTNTGLLGAQQTIYDMWGGQSGKQWGNAVNLTAGQSVPIAIEYFENAGDADFRLLIKSSNLAETEVPEKWLTPEAEVLPDGWRLGVDMDGKVAYDRLRPAGNNIILEDASGGTHEYTWTGSGYKPPVDQNGHLTRNADNTYTLIDTDGRQYVFNASGKLVELTSPEDDKQPAALKYEYAGDPSRLVKITDGVNDERSGTLFYRGVNEADNICDTASSFDDAPQGMLCAFKTSDGDITKLQYKEGRLSRIQKPGNELDDYGYDTLGRINSIRDSTANDAVAYGVRSDNATVRTELSYDDLGRINSIKAPGATESSARNNHTFTYEDSQLRPLYRYNNNQTPVEHTTTTRPILSGYGLEERHGYLLATQKPGTIPIYECRINNDNFISRQATCEGQVTIGMHGYIYTASQPGTVALYRCIMANSQHFTSRASNCEGQGNEGIQGYILTSEASSGNTRMHVEGASEPHGFSKRIEYDSLLRTTKETNLANLSSTTVWDSTKDLVKSSTDATGLKSTTIYDREDRPVEQYKPAPSAWYGSDDKPLAAYINKVPKVTTGYDEGLNGPAVSWYDVRGNSLVGSPRLNTLGINALDQQKILRDSTVLPINKQTGFDGVGVRASGNVYVTTTGAYTFSASHDDALRVWVNDNLVIDKWTNRSDSVTVASGSANLVANQPNRVLLEYANYGTTRSAFSLDLTGHNQNTTGSSWGTKWRPSYGLTTSETAYDGQLGSITTQMQYKNPAYGQIEKATLDPSGLNYESRPEFEAPGVGFLRQTSKTLPGGTRTEYIHYSATDTRDNPCTAETESYRQAGRPKGKIEADPDGSGPKVSRTSETIYNESGAIVATKYNNDDWTCLSYDARGRTIETIIPSRVENGETIQGRTITNNYAVDDNPLKTSVGDSEGAVVTSTDLIGQTLEHVDVRGDKTTSSYDDFGKLLTRVSPIGSESFEYDQYDRLKAHKLDNVKFADITYDQYSRISGVIYPAGISLLPALRDELGRVSKLDYSVSGQNITDQVTYSSSGLALSGLQNGVNKSYAYDKAGRLTSATIGQNSFGYNFDSPDTSCSSLLGNNQNAAKNSNRTSYTLNGQTTTYCYDLADRLITSSNPSFSEVEYDSHGNTTSLGADDKQTRFVYDTADRNTSIEESIDSAERKTVYKRDATDRIYSRTDSVNGSVQREAYYGYADTSDTPTYLKNSEGEVIQKYLTLVGGVQVVIKPQSSSAGATTYSLTSLKGDVMATVNADGAATIITPMGPFGERLPNRSAPNNALTGTSRDYLGAHQKITETDFLINPIQMGARVYIPELGRFLQVDPVEGGTLNDYVYVADPVNQKDLSGEFAFIPVAIVFAKIIFAIVVASLPVMIPKIAKSPAGRSGAAKAATSAASRAGSASAGRATASSSARHTPQPSRPSSPPAPKQVQKPAPDRTHGNSLSSQRPTWVYRLRSNSDGSLLKNGITSKAVPEKRYTKDFMKDKYMDASLQPNRRAAYDIEYQLNLVQPGPLNKNLH